MIRSNRYFLTLPPPCNNVLFFFSNPPRPCVIYKRVKKCNTEATKLVSMYGYLTLKGWAF